MKQIGTWLALAITWLALAITWIVQKLMVIGAWIVNNWALFVARMSMVSMSLGASYTVYSNNVAFVGPWFALTNAGSFELTTIALAAVETTDEKLKKRVEWVRYGALAVSVLNACVFAALHLKPELATSTNDGWIVFQILLHGLPLSLLSFFIGAVTLHNAGRTPASYENEIKDLNEQQNLALEALDAAEAEVARQSAIAAESLSLKLLLQAAEAKVKDLEATLAAKQEPKQAGPAQLAKQLKRGKFTLAALLDAFTAQFAEPKEAAKALGITAAKLNSLKGNSND